jgi:hypothetical protein
LFFKTRDKARNTKVMRQAHHSTYSTFSSSSSSEEGKGEKWNGGVGEETGEETEQCVRE